MSFASVLVELFIQGRVHVLVDLDETTFFDSLGFGALVAARRKAQVFNGSLGIVCSNPRMISLFEITGLDRVFTITSSCSGASAGRTLAEVRPARPRSGS